MTDNSASPNSASPTIRQQLAAWMALMAAVGFVVTLGWQLYAIWTTPSDVVVGSNPRLDYLASGLVGLVGGVVAVGLGQKPPSGERATWRFANVVGRGISSNTNVAKFLAIAYVIVYFVVGIAALATWVARPHTTPPINSFAVSFLGLAFAVVSDFFQRSG